MKLAGEGHHPGYGPMLWITGIARLTQDVGFEAEPSGRHYDSRACQLLLYRYAAVALLPAVTRLAETRNLSTVARHPSTANLNFKLSDTLAHQASS